MKYKSIESRSEVALGNMKNPDLIILPAAFADPTTALRPFAIAIVFGVRDEESLSRAEDQIRCHIWVNHTGLTFNYIAPKGVYYM
jgi:hypothetical protein